MQPLLTWTWPETPLTIATIIVVALVLRWLIQRAIRTFVNNSVKVVHDRRADHATKAQKLLGQLDGPDAARQESRTRTLGSILRSTTTAVIGTIAVIQILDTLGAPMGAIIASAGIGGAALAFGAQSLIKDFFNGAFMIMEDQFGVGDVIDTGVVVGTVEDVALRITRIRDANGEIWYVRNGEITRVGNQSQGWSMATVSVPVAIDEDAGHVIQVLNQAMDAFYDDSKWEDALLERPEVAGVDKMTADAMTIKIFAKCAPTTQGGVQRGLLAAAQEALRRAGVRAPSAAGASPASPDGR